MHRPTHRFHRRNEPRFTAILIAAAVALGCSVPPETTIVGDFFAASRVRDLTALARFSTVVFEPRERGTVSNFAIRRVSPERSDGDTVTKDVVVEAPVRNPDGTVTDRILTIRLQRRRNAGPERALYNGWLVTGVTDGPAALARPPS